MGSRETPPENGTPERATLLPGATFSAPQASVWARMTGRAVTRRCGGRFMALWATTTCLVNPAAERPQREPVDSYRNGDR